MCCILKPIQVTGIHIHTDTNRHTYKQTHRHTYKQKTPYHQDQVYLLYPISVVHACTSTSCTSDRRWLWSWESTRSQTTQWSDTRSPSHACCLSQWPGCCRDWWTGLECSHRLRYLNLHCGKFLCIKLDITPTLTKIYFEHRLQDDR